MIVIGVANTDRTRDFTPTKSAERPTSGGADNFIKFMQKELMPFVEKNYRTQPFNLLLGHSLCGMFSVYTLFTHPDMFNAHIAVSPYLMYNDKFVVKKVESMLNEKSAFKNYLYITIGDEPTYTETLAKFTQLLKDKVKALKWEFSARQSEDHSSVPLKSLYDGLEFIFAGWKLPPEIANKSIPAIEDHYKKLSDNFGYKIQVPEFIINRLGYQLMGNGKIEEAIKTFRYNVVKYPKSANVYDSLGEGYENNKQYDFALKNYEIAVKKGEKAKDPNLSVYKQHIERVQKKMADD
jgi:hypothetical protein